MRPMPGDFRQFSLLTLFIVMTSVACTMAAERWALLAPAAFATFDKVALSAVYVGTLSAMLTNGFGTLRR